MSNTTRYVRLNDWDPSDAAIILRFMIIGNDIAMSYRLQRLIRDATNRDTREFDEGAEQYILRLASAQVFEALSILPELRKNNSMKIILGQNDEARQAFERLIEYKEGGTYEKAWRILRSIRNKGMFHYESLGEALVEALNRMLDSGIKTGSVVWTNEPTAPARFVVADQVHQNVFIHKILEHEEGKDYNEALEESSKILNEAQADFAKLAVTIIYQGIRDRYR